MINDWQPFLKIAYDKATESTNPSTQNSAILVNQDGKIIISAINSFPEKIAENEERQRKPLRYKYSIHAERNVIYLAAKLGIKTDKLIMVSPWATCSDCAQAIIQAGIKKLVTHKQALDKSSDWRKDIELAFSMLREANIEIIIFNGKIGSGKILRQGKFWEP